MLEKRIWRKRDSGEYGTQRHDRKHCARMSRYFLLAALLLLLVACSLPLHPPGSNNHPDEFKKKVSDADMIHEAISFLGTPGQENDYTQARAAFEALMKTYPDSRWRLLSETMIALIDTMQSCKQKDLLLSEKAEEIAGLLHGNDALRKDIVQLQEKLKTETSRLSEENERLKKDIQLLKKLEVELEQREKELR